MNHQSSWTLSVFNIYNRYNPYFIYYSKSGDFLNGNLKVKAKHEAYATYKQEHEDIDHTAVKELRQELDKAMNSLPEQCRTIFQMSRFESLKYRDIAAILKISEKTVEAQMSKALRILRTRLSKFLPVLLMMFINVKN